MDCCDWTASASAHRPHAPRTGVCARVPLQVEGVVEALAAEGAEVALDVRVALHVPVQQAQQVELLGAEPAHVGLRVLLADCGRENMTVTSGLMKSWIDGCGKVQTYGM